VNLVTLHQITILRLQVVVFEHVSKLKLQKLHGYVHKVCVVAEEIIQGLVLGHDGFQPVALFNKDSSF